MKLKRFPNYKQRDSSDCGPTCLKIVGAYYGVTLPTSKLRQVSETTREGSSLKGISDAAEKVGFRTTGVKMTYQGLLEKRPLPCILHWKQNHFVVLYKIKGDRFYVSDPAQGRVNYDRAEFLENWNGGDKESEGIALLIEPTPELTDIEEEEKDKRGFAFLFSYVTPYKKFLFQLGLGLVAGSLLQLAFPFLTQSIVDIGVRNRDIGFVYLILMAQLFVFLGRTSIEVIRGWILLHLSTRINVSLVSDFFIKLMGLPIAFFDTRLTGDLLQRVHDHRRIENLLTTTSLNILFSMFNLVIFGAVLAFYSFTIFWIFLGGSVLYFVWILIFLKKRKTIDYTRFSYLSDEQSKVVELINGMQEIKLNNAEKAKRWSWEHLQAKLFKVETRNLALEQKQRVGSNVGASGSGKTTLMKVLLRFYGPDEGRIRVGQVDLSRIAPSAWRQACGVVMQEGYLFNDTIEHNIAVGKERIDRDRLIHATEVAMIRDMIEDLPLGFKTWVGQEGTDLSTGQKQRILIARAVYKDPRYIFFDEATSALDANNEREIINNLGQFFQDRTAVVCAHRLSTVRNADQIVVLDEGRILEKGSHQELIENKGPYFHLVKNQLEMDKLNEVASH